MRQQHRGALVVATVAAGLVVGAPPAAPADAPGSGPRNPGDTPCTSTYEITVSPGLTLTPSRGTYTTGGYTGEIVCTGTVDGKRITGPGTLDEVGRYGVSKPWACTDLDADGVQQTAMRLPTEGGTVEFVDDPTRLSGGPLREGGLVGGTFEGVRFYGTFTAEPVTGDCVTAPLTRARIALRGWIAERS